MPFRLDMQLDLYAVTYDNVMMLLSQSEMDEVVDAERRLQSCWPEPHPAQVWAAITAALGHDPRET